MVDSLLAEQSLILRVNCMLKGANKMGRGFRTFPCSLDITVHGPFELFDDIGIWFQEYEIYLQDPDICHLDVKYCNPQKMSSHQPEAWSLVSDVVAKKMVLSPEEIPQCSDFLDILSSHLDLEETPQPAAITAALKRYVAYTWLKGN